MGYNEYPIFIYFDACTDWRQEHGKRHGLMLNNLKHNLLQLAIALDQLANVLLSVFTGNKAWSDETLSARAYRHARIKKDRMWPMWIIDHLFFWQDQHCKAAYESELERSQLPPSMRE